MASDKEGLTLWQIDAGIAAALEDLCDEDGVINEEAEKRLADLEMERPRKIENCALFIKNRRAMAAAIRAEEMSLADRRHRYEADAERVERLLERSLAGERFETSKVCIRWRKSQAVEIDLGAEMGWSGEDVYRFIKYTSRIDKDAVKKALKAGEDVPGARIVTKNNMTIEGVR